MPSPSAGDAESHFLLRIKRDDVNPEQLRLWLGNTAFAHPKKHKRPRLEKASPASLRYTAMQEAHRLFSEYIESLKKSMSDKAFSPIVYRAELTGALASAQVHGQEMSPLGIIAEERENVVRMVFPGDSVKTYPKKSTNFILYLKSTKYLLIGRALKLNRFVSK